jgi:succinate dehydrogenase / fumarate reductase cytochrome b subunit
MTATVAGIGGRVSVPRFWSTTNGKKAVMAVSGVALAGFIAGHLLGNLQIFLGPERFNGYARTLHSLPELLWPVRIVLLAMVVLHIWSSVQLSVIKSEARPLGYAQRKNIASTYASRTMYMSGPIIAAFVVYHLMQFTFGAGGTHYEEADAYGNVIAGFRVPAISTFYILAMALLCLHLRHGLWSMLQTLGFYHPRFTPRIRTAATVIATLVFLGFSSIPVAVLAGVIPQVL